jgi:capsular exopolysaccharide synthesis family protein
MATQQFDSRLVSFTSPASFAAEQYQGLRLTIERLARTRGGAQVIGVTSPAAGEGKTVTSANLAGALARGAEARVLLIDADLRRPAVARTLGLLDGHINGLSDVIAEPQPLQAVARQIDPYTLWVLPAGSSRTQSGQTLRSPRLEQLLREARQQYDYVVIDTPPLLPVFDSALISRLVDGMLVVVAANQTPRKLLGEALNLVDPTTVMGIVFNRDDRPLFGYYDEYYREYFPETSGVATGA